MGELINIYDIIFHLINLIILVVAARFLLYKPVVKFMSKRRERFVHEREEINTAQAEIAAFKEKSEKLIEEAEDKADKYLKQQQAIAEKEAEKIIATAKEVGAQKAAHIVADARAQAKAEFEEHKQEVVVSAVDIAKFVLDRQITVEDDNKLIEDFLSKAEELNFSTKLFADAKLQCKSENEEMVKEKVSSAVDIAKNILKREITAKDDEKLIEEFISDQNRGDIQ